MNAPRKAKLSSVKLRQFAVEELELRGQVLAQSLARAWELHAEMTTASEKQAMQPVLDALKQEINAVADDLVAARAALADAKHEEQWGAAGSDVFHVHLALQSPRSLHNSSSGNSNSNNVTAVAAAVPMASLPHVPLEACAQRAMLLHQRGDDTRLLRDFGVLQQAEPFAVRPVAAAVASSLAPLQRATPHKFEHARVEMQILEEAVGVSQRYLAHGAQAFQSPEAFDLQRAQHRRLQDALRASRVVVRESMALLNMPPDSSLPAADDADGAAFDFRDVCAELGMSDDAGGYGFMPAQAARVVSPPPRQLPLSPRRPTSPTPFRPAPALAQSAPAQVGRSPFRKPPAPAHQALPKVAATELPDVPLSPRAAARPHAATEIAYSSFPAARAQADFRLARMSVGPKAATLFKVVGLWDYDNGGNQRKLSFAKDEVLDVVAIVGEWFHCTNAVGFEGLVPANRVARVD